MKAGILGASGYTGAELLRLLAGHPEFEVAVATAHSHAGEAVGAHTPVAGRGLSRPGLRGERSRPLRRSRPGVLRPAPRGVPADRPGAAGAGRPGRRPGGRLPAAATLRSTRRWYGEEHAAPELLADAVYGLPELFRDGLAGATLVAAAGCYPTAAGLALAPLVRAGLVEPTGIVVDAASGVSGAGRGLKESLHFGTVDEDFTAYGLLTHRHTPEMEQILGARGALHAAPGADGARHPGHLLRPARRGHQLPRPTPSWPPCTTPTTPSRSSS